MVLSMTAFASASAQGEWGTATWELRSVNHRYLDIHLKFPDYLIEGEIAWRKCISKHLQRGKIDCQLNIRPGTQFSPKLSVNQPLLSQLIQEAQAIQNAHSHILNSAPALNYLNWPGVISTEKQDVSELLPILSDLLSQAIQDLIAMRKREGEDIRLILDNKVNELTGLVERARACVPNSLAKQKEKLEAKLQELAQNNSERIEQEMVIFASKWDVEEELDRLLCHAQEIKKQMFEASGPKGRRLDFLMQELNREANTLASKSQDTELSNIAVDLKVIIEQMREQIQNVE